MQRRRASPDERVLQVAGQLFLRYGFEKTTMDDIAREAGVAKATLYRYWPSKEALFESLLYREIREVNRAFLARIEADPQGGRSAGSSTTRSRRPTTDRSCVPS